MLFSKRKRKLRRILIVEDEPLVAFDNEHLLSASGYEVVATVDSLADAQAVIEGEALDLILTDIRLRGAGDGMDVARAAGGRGVHVLFVSGHCPPEAEALAIGILAKPYNDVDLKAALEVVEAIVGGRKVRKLPRGLKLCEPYTA